MATETTPTSTGAALEALAFEERRFPMPDPLRPAIPWPPF